MKQANSLIHYLVGVGMADDQNESILRPIKGGEEITFEHAGTLSAALRKRPYSESYEILAAARAYNIKLPDGALVQMSYEFMGRSLRRHRLAFLPCPSLEEFQNNPEIYLADEVYADVTDRRIVPCPIRFDYDARDEVLRELSHPRSHLTIGQYQNCRIPVTAPMTPAWFIDFVLRNFYHTAHERYADKLPRDQSVFEPSITSEERKIVHIALPG